ncbi:MAG: prepilin-type N-terminal cleavage/methylation domain-containing protein [Gammaproteobacteria bacterium]|jgi:MSHA pilin protein MshC
MKYYCNTNQYRGFTLIEVIVVIILVGILAAYSIPKLDLDAFRAQGFEQQATAAIRYGQKQAIGSGCNINVNIVSVTECTVTYGAQTDAGCVGAVGDSLVNPGTGLNNFCDSSEADSSAMLPASVQFDRIGRPSGSLSINFGTTIITIEPETGFVYE